MSDQHHGRDACMRKFDSVVKFRVTPDDRVTVAPPSQVTDPAPRSLPYTPGCRCGCNDGRRVR